MSPVPPASMFRRNPVDVLYFRHVTCDDLSWMGKPWTELSLHVRKITSSWSLKHFTKTFHAQFCWGIFNLSLLVVNSHVYWVHRPVWKSLIQVRMSILRSHCTSMLCLHLPNSKAADTNSSLGFFLSFWFLSQHSWALGTYVNATKRRNKANTF